MTDRTLPASAVLHVSLATVYPIVISKIPVYFVFEKGKVTDAAIFWYNFAELFVEFVRSKGVYAHRKESKNICGISSWQKRLADFQFSP